MEQISKRLMNWASILEDNTRQHAHLGKGATVGSVIPTLGAIIPAAVGVDIGCGMMAIETGLHAEDLPADKAPLHAAISTAVPLSAGKYNQDLYSDETAARVKQLEEQDGIEQAEAIAPNWRLQLGSLGSGNHFIEVSLDEADGVWLSGTPETPMRCVCRALRYGSYTGFLVATHAPRPVMSFGGHEPTTTRRCAVDVPHVNALPGQAASADPRFLPIIDRAFDRPGGPTAKRLRSRVCPLCSIRDTCLSMAMDHGEFGVWGGTSPTIRTKLGGAKPLTHGAR